MLLNANPIALVAFEKSSGSRLPSIIIQDFPGNQNKKKRCIIYKLTYTFPGRDVSELEGGAPRKIEEPKRRKHNCADATGSTKTARAFPSPPPPSQTSTGLRSGLCSLRVLSDSVPSSSSSSSSVPS